MYYVAFNVVNAFLDEEAAKKWVTDRIDSLADISRIDYEIKVFDSDEAFHNDDISKHYRAKVMGGTQNDNNK